MGLNVVKETCGIDSEANLVLLKELLGAGIDPKGSSPNGETAPMFAVNANIMEVLIVQ